MKLRPIGVIRHAVVAVNAGVSFTIVSTGTETSVVFWEIRRPG